MKHPVPAVCVTTGSLSACAWSILAQCVCLWMHNGLHWQLTACGSFLRRRVLNWTLPDQYDACSAPRKRPINVQQQRNKNNWNQYWFLLKHSDTCLDVMQDGSTDATTENISVGTHALNMTLTQWDSPRLRGQGRSQWKGHNLYNRGDSFIYSIIESSGGKWLRLVVKVQFWNKDASEHLDPS